MGNVRYTTDFRSVYATVLERWLGRPSQNDPRREFRTTAYNRLRVASSCSLPRQRRRAIRRRASVSRIGRHVAALWRDADSRRSRAGRARAGALARAAVQSA